MSPYVRAAGNLRENGYSPMPVAPGTKVPGTLNGVGWGNLSGWQKYCKAPAPEFVHLKWEAWPDAGVCIAHGSVICLDLDCDRKGVEEAIGRAIPWPACRRKGAKGWAGYYRPGAGMGDLGARIRWHDSEGNIVLELLLDGTQSVIPPTIHPNGHPYVWMDAEALTDTPVTDLPLFELDYLEKLDAELEQIGVTRKKLQRVNLGKYGKPVITDHDLEKAYGRSVNDRAMEPTAIDQWWPALELLKSRQRGPGAWEAVASWRPSNSGRPPQDRNPNLKVIPTGIVDFGADRSYTPIDLVMAAHDCSWERAAEWLEQYIRPEKVEHIEITAPKAEEPPPEPKDPPRCQKSATPAPERMTSSLGKLLQRGPGRRRPVKPAEPSSDEEFDIEFPSEDPPFPVQDYERDLSGVLRDLTIHIDASSRMRSEQGAFGTALALLATIMGGRFEFSDEGVGLRTNMYVIGTADSGAGKSSAISAMKRVAARTGVSSYIAGSDFTSGAAILNELGSNRPQLFCIDEFGDVMRRILGARAASHEQDIRRILKDLYSSATGVYHGKSYASQERIDLIEPHLCIAGASTYEAFWGGIDGSSFRDGLIARFIVIPIGETEVQVPTIVYADEVDEGIRAICQARGGVGNLGDQVVRKVEARPAVLEQYRAQWEMNRRHAKRADMRGLMGASSIIMRISENAMKIALVSAASRWVDDPVITQEDYDLGYAVAHWSAISMINAIGQYYVESEAHRNVKRIVEVVTAGGPDWVSKWVLSRKTQGMNGREREDAIKTALDSKLIVEGQIPPKKTGGKATTLYRAAEFIEDGI